MITIFTTAKPFVGQMKVNQINALKSWKAIAPDVEILLFGNGEGYSQVARDLGISRVTDVETNEYGIPLVSSMFELAGIRGRFRIQAYVNCDLILFADLARAVQQVQMDRFLMVGQRWDIDWNRAIDFDDLNWQKTVRDEALLRGSQMDPSGMDYFLFTRGIWEGVAPVVVGRACYDNYLIYFCRSRYIPVIDASQVVTAVHQNHDYGHVSGKAEVWSGAEAKRNLDLAGGWDHILTIADAGWSISRGGLSRNRCRGDWLRWLEVNLIIRGDRAWARFARLGVKVAKHLRSRLRTVHLRLVGAGRRFSQ